MKRGIARSPLISFLCFALPNSTAHQFFKTAQIYIELDEISRVQSQLQPRAPFALRLTRIRVHATSLLLLGGETFLIKAILWKCKIGWFSTIELIRSSSKRHGNVRCVIFLSFCKMLWGKAWKQHFIAARVKIFRGRNALSRFAPKFGAQSPLSFF